MFKSPFSGGFTPLSKFQFQRSKSLTYSTLKEFNDILSDSPSIPSDPSNKVKILTKLLETRQLIDGLLASHDYELTSLLVPTPLPSVPSPSCTPPPGPTAATHAVSSSDSPTPASGPPARSLFPPSSVDFPPSPSLPSQVRSRVPPVRPPSPPARRLSRDAETLDCIQSQLALDYAANGNKVAISGTSDQIQRASAALGPSQPDIVAHLSRYVHGHQNLISVVFRPCLILITVRTKALARQLRLTLRSKRIPADFMASGVSVRPALSRLQRAYKDLIYRTAIDLQGHRNRPLIFWDGHMGYYEHKPILPEASFLPSLARYLKTPVPT